MVESLAGEIIGLFAGFACCIPLIYQINSQLTTPTKSPISRYCWWLWSLAWLGLGSFFCFVPRVDQKQLLDTPESPRTLGYCGFLACLLCQVVWALDGISPAAVASRKIKSLAQQLTPTLCITILLAAGIRLVHKYFILSRPFYRDFLAFVSFILIVCYYGASIIAPLELNPAQIKSGGPEVAGLFWIPMAMQMLGLFAAIFSCVLIYTNPEWYGIILLCLVFSADAVYIGVGVFRVMRQRVEYGPIA